MIDRVVVLGGGLAGMAAALGLARSGVRRVTIVERGGELGGLAGTFHSEGNFYPLAYHHVLHRDSALLWALREIGALDDVRWRRIRMLFRVPDGRLLDLGHPVDFLRFPMSLADKLRFVRLMVRSFGKSDWRDWNGRSARELVDTWGGPGVREALFEPLSHLKFDRPSEDLSGAWLGARLSFREGSAPLGYIPGCNWTKVLCDGVTRLLDEAGAETRLHATVTGLGGEGRRIRRVELEGGETLDADAVVSALPTEVYGRMLPDDETPGIREIRYTAVLSVICTTRQPIDTDFYWMNLASRDCTAGGIFRLEALNPTIGAPGETCLNFVSHVPSRHEEIFSWDDDRLLGAYFADFERVFGFPVEPTWTRIGRLPTYSPVFLRGYANPPVRSTTWENVWFAGNYRTFPSIASTGTALHSGLEAACALLDGPSAAAEMRRDAEAFRLPRMTRG